MAIPATTTVWAENMDPYDIVDYTIDCSGMLEVDEVIDSFTITPLAEAAALGLTINNSGGYATQLLDGKSIRFWLSVIPEEQDNSIFAGGVILPLELTITTNSTPPRRKQRTLGVKVVQR